nr:major facilitator superfamily domain, general substrate transporter [Tanacetum cinerariifolium]
MEGTKRTQASGRLMKLKEANGFGNFVKFKVDGIPSKLGLYVVDKFNAKKRDIKLAEGSLKITKNLISEMLRIRNEGIDIMAEEGNRNEEMGEEDEELNSGGFGFGEIEGTFVEQEDPMPDNIKGFVWKLNKHVNFIIKEKSGFEKTLDAAEYIFLGKLEGFIERYVDALKYQGCRKERSGNENISDANRAADAQAAGQNNEGACFVIVQAIIGEGAIGLGDEHADTGTTVGRLRRDTDKRLVMISKVRKSPFIGRVVNADSSLNAEEKRVTKYLFEVLEDHGVTLFKTISGQQSTRVQMQTLAQREYVDNNILDTWGSVLNHMEVYRNKESPFRMFLPTFVVIFIPFDNGGHKFLFVADLKNSRPLLIDHEKNEKIVRKRVKKKIEACENLTVAAMLQEDFGQYLMVKNHTKDGNFIGSEIEVREFDWQTITWKQKLVSL